MSTLLAIYLVQRTDEPPILPHLGCLAGKFCHAEAFRLAELLARNDAAEQANAIRAAAVQLLQTMQPQQRTRVLYAFPLHAAPVAAKFAGHGGMSGPHGIRHWPAEISRYVPALAVSARCKAVSANGSLYI